MTDVQLALIIYGSITSIENTTLCFPIRFYIVHNIASLIRHISTDLKQMEKRMTRYFILLLDPIDVDVGYYYGQLEENPQVLAVFLQWNNTIRPAANLSKLYYIPTLLLTQVVALSSVQFLKTEAAKQVKSDQSALAKLYLRRAKTIKEWMMSHVRAEPCHVLVIPLNTSTNNLTETLQHVREYCSKFGYPSAVVHSLDDYIPKGEIFDKLPYGKLIFEYEDPNTICRWLRCLSPIRLYLVGNEDTIPYEWSKLMIANEIDSSTPGTAHDEDWHTCLEHEPIKDQVKWNFSTKYAKGWQIKQFMPLQLNTLGDNIRFQSALRRAHKTFDSRMATVTTQTFLWFDLATEHEYMNNEFKLNEHNKGHVRNIAARSDPVELTVHLDEKDLAVYSLPYSANYSTEIANCFQPKSAQIFIWLDDCLYSIQQRFQSLVSPLEWKYVSNIHDCQKFIVNQQSRNNPKIVLISSYSSAEEYFSRGYNTSNMIAVYLYSNRNDILSSWTNHYPVIRGIYSDLNRLFERFEADTMTSNEQLIPLEKQEMRNAQPVRFFNADFESFQRLRAFINQLTSIEFQSDAKEEMLANIFDLFSENQISSRDTQEFIDTYHSDAAIQWYTRDNALYRLINQTLASMDMELIFKYKFLITDLYNNLTELHQHHINADSRSEEQMLTVYRGQLLSSDEIELLTQNIGCLTSFNSFVSTSQSLDIALMFACSNSSEREISSESVIFKIDIDRSIRQSQPFACINMYSAFEDEEEVLFSIGSIFLIEKVGYISVNDPIRVVHLKMIDETDFDETNPRWCTAKSISKQTFNNSMFVVVGSNYLFQSMEHSEELLSILAENNVLPFETTEEFIDYTESKDPLQTFIVFIHDQLVDFEENERMKFISFSDETHRNDLIYELIYNMEITKGFEAQSKDLYAKVSQIVCPTVDTDFYVQLLPTATGRNDFESRLRSKLSSSSNVTFYKLESCLTFLRSISNDKSIGNATLILQSDEYDVNDVIDRCEYLNSIKYIYLCFKDASTIPYRKIIHGKFENEHDLLVRLITDNLHHSLQQVDLQIHGDTNINKATQYLQLTESYYKLL